MAYDANEEVAASDIVETLLNRGLGSGFVGIVRLVSAVFDYPVRSLPVNEQIVVSRRNVDAPAGHSANRG
jgi:hypothetical protein